MDPAPTPVDDTGGGDARRFSTTNESATSTAIEAGGRLELELEVSLSDIIEANGEQKAQTMVLQRAIDQTDFNSDQHQSSYGSCAASGDTSGHSPMASQINSPSSAIVASASAANQEFRASDSESDVRRHCRQATNHEHLTSPPPPPSPSLPPSSEQPPPWKNPLIGLVHDSAVMRDWFLANTLLEQGESNIFTFLKIAIVYLVIPLLSVAFVLYYLAGNPLVGNGALPSTASASWWALFAARNVITLSLAKLLELVVIDYLCLNTGVVLRLAGPIATLFLTSSKGWPFVLGFWSLADFLLLVGPHPFAKHWLYHQSQLAIFNDSNPAGTITTSEAFHIGLFTAMIIPMVVSAKRLVVGLYLSQRTLCNFAEPLSKVMEDMLLIAEVSGLSRNIERQAAETRTDRPDDSPFHRHSGRKKRTGPSPDAKNSEREEHNNNVTTGNDKYSAVAVVSQDDLSKLLNNAPVSNLTNSSDMEEGKSTTFSPIVSNDRPISVADKARMSRLLGDWKDPMAMTGGPKIGEGLSITSMLHFRRALGCMDTDFPFSRAFGCADTRERCVTSSQQLFRRLLLRSPSSKGALPFETIATIALDKLGKLDMVKAKKLVTLFRPDCDGRLSLLEFAGSVDSVYKDFKLMRASIDSASQVDHAAEQIFNGVFYMILAVAVVLVLGFNPFRMFLSFSTIILSFTFMIKGASTSYAQGVLFILAQRPYNIGDRINVSSGQVDSPGTGSQGWIVEDVTLFTTSLVLAATNERATVSNGALAKSRVINCARSAKAVVSFVMKFGLNVPYSKIKLFKIHIKTFVQARPREWISMQSFRSTKVEADLGYCEYRCALQHRESWQNIGAILQSKSMVQQFCIELQKHMRMTYESPPLPVEISTVFGNGINEQNIGMLLNGGISTENGRKGCEDISCEHEDGFDANASSIFAMFEEK